MSRFLSKLLSRLVTSRGRSTRKPQRPRSRRFLLEVLEDRIVPTGPPYMNYDAGANTLFIGGGANGSQSNDSISFDTTFLDGETFYNVTDRIGQLGITLTGQFQALQGMQIAIDAGDGINNIDVYDVALNNTVNITNSGGGLDYVDVGVLPGLGFHRLAGIQGAVNIVSPTGRSLLTIDDSGDSTAHLATLNDGSYYWNPDAAPITWTPTGSGTVGTEWVSILGGSSNNTFVVLNTSNFSGLGGETDLITGAGNNEVDVAGTSGSLGVFGGGGHDTVNFGSTVPSIHGSLSGIQGAVNVANAAGSTRLTISDIDDTTGQAATLDDGILTWSSYAAPITWTPTASATGGVSSATINGGSGGNTFTVNNTSNLYLGTTINTGAGTNTVDVLGTRSDLFIQGNGGQDTVIVGSTDGSSGSLANIHGQVSADNTSTGTTSLTIDNSTDTTARTATLSYLYFLIPPATFIHQDFLSWNAYAAPIVWYPADGVTSVTINGGNGNNTFSVVNTDPFGVAAPTTLNTGSGNNTVRMLGSFSSPLTINGGSGSNTLVGPDAANTWSVTAQNAGTLSGLVSATFSGVQNLTGGSGADDFVFADGAGVDGNIDGGGGSNTLDESAYSTGVTVNLQTNTATGVRGTYTNLQTFIGSAGGGNTLLGPNAPTTWNVTAQNAGTLTGGFSFTGFGNLTGGSAADDFVLSDGAGVDGIIDGGGGANALDLSAYSTPVTVDLTANAATGVGGGFANVQSFVGNGANGTLLGPNADTTWNLGGSNAGTLTGGFAFAAFVNLTGGAGNNTFAFAAGASVGGTITGGGGSNALNYAAYTTTVIVDLQTGTATGAGGIANVQNVTGGSGGGTGVYNLLVGNGGNVLTGGDGRRNLLTAGASASTLLGGNGDDILIGGSTAYDTEAGLTSLNALMAYWSGTTDNYATRVSNLLSGNGVPLLDATQVTNNGGGNTLTGNHGGAGELNLFYGLSPTQETTDYNPGIGEQFIDV